LLFVQSDFNIEDKASHLHDIFINETRLFIFQLASSGIVGRFFYLNQLTIDCPFGNLRGAMRLVLLRQMLNL
jgi:hypothetical protein